MLFLAQSKQKILFGSSWQAPPRSLDSIAAMGRAGALNTVGPLGRALEVVFGGRGAEEVGDDLDREDAVDLAPRVDQRRVLGLALEHVGESVAHDVVAVEHRSQRRVR